MVLLRVQRLACRWPFLTLQPLKKAPALSCSQQRHLLVGSEIHCWIKISISRLAADTIRDTSVTSADLFFSLFGDDHAIMAIWQKMSCISHKTSTKGIVDKFGSPKILFLLKAALMVKTMMMMRDIGQ